MKNEELIRNLIKGSLWRAIQESVAAAVVLFAFAAILAQCDVGSPRYYGCLIILVWAGFIAGVVWSHALSFRLLRSHSAKDIDFWREAFHAQARLLRLVPLWYCAPLLAGGLVFVAPTRPSDLALFLILAAGFVIFFAAVAWLNRRAASKIDAAAAQLS